jgi:tetratricopeptide (TPR) repeat protein
MKVWAGLLITACATLAAAPVAASVDEAWLEVQEGLSASEGTALNESIDDLVRAAEEIDVRRLTPYAAALVAWSLEQPADSTNVLETAIRIDPQLPSPYFILAGQSWQRDSYLESAGYYLRGWLAMVRNEVSRRHLAMSGAIWIVLGCVATGIVTMVVIMLWTLRRTAFDAFSVGGMIFERANAIVFGSVLVLLPLVAGLGPTWLLVYLFIAGWVCLDRSQRGVAIGVCAVLAVVPALLETAQRTLLNDPPVTGRVAVMLDERQLNPSVLREFLELEEVFENDSRYHLILGELFRMHSAIESAKVEFQAATADPGGDARPYVFLGNMALEDGNVQLAIQHYDAAIDIEEQTPLAYHNLSSAYDLIRRFQQGDNARARARELAGGRSASLGVRGRDPRVRYPEVTSADVDRFVASLSEEESLQAGFGGFSLRSAVQLLSPISVPFWLGGLAGIGVLAFRSRWFPGALECTKCGKVYRLEDEPGESPVYCRQCVSVFLQRDQVPIDQQTAKLAQVRRWNRWTGLSRRLAAVLAPGSAMVINGRVMLGIAVGVVAWTSLIGLVVWVPRFLRTIEPTIAVQPVVTVLAMVFVVCWLLSILGSWRRS